MKRYKNYLMDMDGVLVRGRSVVPGRGPGQAGLCCTTRSASITLDSSSRLARMRAMLR